jgi:hypothetical protein
MEIKFKLLPPIMPNYISYEGPTGRRQDGVKDEKFTIAVADLTAEEAKEYGQLMADTFFKHWKEKFAAKGKP